MFDSLGERIRASRRLLEMTLDDLAGASGLSKGFLSDIENDKRNPSANNILILSDKLKVSVEWLLRGKHPKPVKCPYCKGTGKLS